MAKSTPEKISRNNKIVQLKKGGKGKKPMTFKNLAAMFNLSDTRVKAIYYRAIKKG
jgi:DNA-directed RNA polymerase sigma subunit (sigma70/sigma32)